MWHIYIYIGINCFWDGWIGMGELPWSGRPRLSLTKVSINIVAAPLREIVIIQSESREWWRRKRIWIKFYSFFLCVFLFRRGRRNCLYKISCVLCCFTYSAWSTLVRPYWTTKHDCVHKHASSWQCVPVLTFGKDFLDSLCIVKYSLPNLWFKKSYINFLSKKPPFPEKWSNVLLEQFY